MEKKQGPYSRTHQLISFKTYRAHQSSDPSVRLAHAVVCGLIALQWRTIEQVSKSFTVLPDLWSVYTFVWFNGRLHQYNNKTIY